MFSQTRTRSPSKAVSRCAPDGLMILTVPVGNVLVGDSGGNVEHDDAALAVDVVAIS